MPHPHPRHDPDAPAAAPMPRWVKAFALAGLVLLALFVALHLAGGGFGNHARP